MRIFSAFRDHGHLDLIASQNYVKWPVHGWFEFPGKVLLATGEGTFGGAGIAPNPSFSNSPLFADLDADDRLDLFWLNNDGPSRAYLNKTAGRAVIVALPDSPRSLGARIRLEGSGTWPVREVSSGTGLGTDHASRYVFASSSRTISVAASLSWPR